MESTSSAVKTTWISMVGNLLLAVCKWVAGYFGNSYALIADAIESTTDVFSSLIVLMGIKYSERPPDKNHPYGHGKAETLVTFLVVGFLITSASIIIYNSIVNIRTPHEVPEWYTLIILGAIILWKEISYRYVIKKSKETGSSLLKADAWHHRSDAITSAAAFVGISIAVFLGKGYESADDWAAIVAAIFIYYNAWLIFRPALGEIMDENVYDELTLKIREISERVEGIKGTEKCFIRKAGMKFHVDLHALVDADLSVREGHDIAHRLKDTLRKEIPELGHVLIHIEPF